MTDSDPETSDAPPPAAVATLVANHRQFLRFLEQRVGSRAEAEDILQEAFVKGVERLGGLLEGESANAWFYRVLRNAVVDHYRRRGARGRAIDDAALQEIRSLLGEGEAPRRRELLIEHLHKIQDRHGHLPAAHLAALAHEMGLARAVVFEVARFYPHFDVVRAGGSPPADKPAAASPPLAP